MAIRQASVLDYLSFQAFMRISSGLSVTGNLLGRGIFLFIPFNGARHRRDGKHSSSSDGEVVDQTKSNSPYLDSGTGLFKVSGID